jgi:general secretion pathway protein I
MDSAMKDFARQFLSRAQRSGARARNRNRSPWNHTSRRVDYDYEHEHEKNELPGKAAMEKTSGGFTLLEVMVALAVMAFAFVALLGLHGRNIALVSRVDDYTRATLIARQLMTQMQFEDFEGLASASGTVDWDPRFRWERVVDPTTLETVKRVQLRVIWNDNRPDACELVYWIAAPTA